ncbi:MAG: tetratricopeptide repeat protein, partial [Egibacteraceae bacterium]
SYHQLGILAQDRGDYETAEARYRQSLEINERLGNQAGMAASYGQLGILAQDRGDYETAEARYRQSLEINERLGNQAGMATSYGQLGLLRAQTGAPREAIPCQIRALAIRLRLRTSNAGWNIARLIELRNALGVDDFLTVVREHLDDDSTQNLMTLLDQADGSAD